MPAPRSVIWDFNGTLLDDVDLAAAAISRLLRRRGLPPVDTARHRRLFAFPAAGYYERLGFDVAAEGLERLSDEFHEAYLAGVDACTLNAGVVDLLDAFAAAGAAQFILSAAQETMLSAWVRHHGLHDRFDAVYGLADRLARSKVKRGADLLRHHGLDPARTLLIGDTDHDAEVARALGCRAVLVLQGHQDRDRVAGLGVGVYGTFDELRLALAAGGGAPG